MISSPVIIIKLEIYNNVGSIMSTEYPYVKEKGFHLDSYTAGIYFVKIYTTTGEVIKKLIITE